jgi:hypothetical protein
MDGDKATIEFTGNGNTTNFDKNALNGNFTSIKDVKVIGSIPTNFETDLFNNQGHKFSACERVDFSEASGAIHTQFHNNVKGVVLPSGKSFNYVTQGGSYVIIANTGDSEENAVQVCVKSGTDWASDPAVDDASYLKVYGSDGTTYLESAEVTALQSTKWVNETGTVISVEDLTIHADSEDETAVLNQFLNVDNKLIKNLTVDGELADLTMFDGVEVKKDVDFSGITNSDLSALKLPNTTGTISLPGGTYQNGTVTLDATYTQDQLSNILAALSNSGCAVNTIAFAGGSTFNCNTNELEVSTADEDGGKLATIASDLRAAGKAIDSVRLEKYGTSWSDNKMILSSDHSDQEVTQKALLEDACFTVSTTKVTKYPDVEVTVDENGVVTVKSFREGALKEMLEASDDEANSYKALITADTAKGEGSKLVLEGAFKAEDLNKLTSLNNATESVDMSNTTFSNAADAVFTYWDNTKLKEGKISSTPNLTAVSTTIFQNMKALTSVSFPSNITKIEDTAFQGFSNLTNVDWGTDCNIEIIGEQAFNGTNLTDTLRIPNSVKTIKTQAFKDNNNITTLIFDEGSQIEYIGFEAFAQAQNTSGKLKDVFVNVKKQIECAKQAFDKFHTAAQTNVGTVTTRLHYPAEFYEYYVGSYKETLWDQNLDYVENGETKHTYGVITQKIIDDSFSGASNGWQEFLSSGIPVGEGSLYRTYSDEVSHLVPDEHKLQIYLVHDYSKADNLAYCVQMKEGDMIPAKTGFIIHSTVVATIYLPHSKALGTPYNHEDYPQNTYKKGGEGDGWNNYLKPINGKLHIDNVEIVDGKKTYRNYFFNNGKTAESRKGPDWKADYEKTGWGFFRAATWDYEVWNKAFLHLPVEMTEASSTVINDSGVLPQDQGGSATTAKSFGIYIIDPIEFEEELGVATSLNSIAENMTSDDAYYTLQGVKVDNPTVKGIYIHNGKKVLVR